MKHQLNSWVSQAFVRVAAPLLILSTACTKNNPIYCDDSGACPDGAACAIDSKVCSDDLFTFDRSQFFDDGVRLWSTTANPILRGTTDQSKATIEVVRGADVIATPAVIDDAGNWSLQLPAGTIVDTDTELKIHLIGDNGTLEFAYKFALDDKAPSLTVVPTEVTDESKDVVTFNNIGEPTHVHQNFPVVLDGAHCANVVKYGYLFDEAPPMYGTEDRRNPMTWTIQLGVKVALDEAKSRYRIMKTGQGTQVDWAPFEPVKTADGFTVSTPITRQTGPNLGEDGDFAIEWEVYDWAGRMVTGQGCWHQTLLAAPLLGNGFQASTRGPAALSTWVLNSIPPVSNLINGTVPSPVYEMTLTNATTEAVDVEITPSAPIVAFSKISWLAPRETVVQTLGNPVVCVSADGSTINPADECTVATPSDTADVFTNTPAAAIPLSFSITILDDTGAVLTACSDPDATGMQRCQIPARASGGAPVVGHVVASLTRLPELNPGVGTAAERIVPGNTTDFGYTGPAIKTMVRCAPGAMVHFGNVTSRGLRCLQTQGWKNHTILRQATLTLQTPPPVGTRRLGPGFKIKTARPNTPATFPYVGTGGVLPNTLQWNSGIRG